MSLRVLVADDAALFRRAISEALAALPEVEVVGTASNGKLALQKTRELKPDLLTLDLEMPEVDGLAVLDALRQNGDKVAVIVVSALTRRGGDLTLRALEKGAFDFITKPDASSAEESRETIRRELAPRLRALAQRLAVRDILRRPSAAPPPPPVAPKPQGTNLDGIAGRMNRLVSPTKPEMVLIGVSTGGPNALSTLLPQIPKDIGVPILITQHMPPVFTQSLADSLATKCSLKVREGAHGETIAPNTVYIAPGGRQMRLADGPVGSRVIQITDDPPENNCRPSVDYLFRSIARHYGKNSTGVIMTGMGHDGTEGLKLMKQNGAMIIAQDESTSAVYGMPRKPVEIGIVDVIAPLDLIAEEICRTIRDRF